MTDHAHELRRYARKIAHPAGDVPAVMLAAADEIERLQARIEAMENQGSLYALPGAQPAQSVPDSAAARDVLAERRRQIEVEGWTPEHDDAHGTGDVALAAACYALNAAGCGCEVARNWPWDRTWWRPSTPRRDLVKAGALILAEIERLDRATAAPEAKP